MQQALERVTKSLEAYSAGSLSKSVANIELVSAFKVACKNSQYDTSEMQSTVQGYIEAILGRIDAGEMARDQAVSELRRVYEAAHNNDHAVLAYMARFA